jgi:methylmalonyl-CoA mutase N-terminal domain/subunit
VILEETGVTDTIDPLGGSWYIESLTDELEGRATALMKEIDEMGGMIEAIDQGFPQREIERAAWAYQQAIEKGEQNIVGVNAYIEDDAVEPEVFRIDPALEKGQCEELAKRKQERDQGRVDMILKEITKTAATDENLFPYILDAVKATASIGEICTALAKVFGRYRDQLAR